MGMDILDITFRLEKSFDLKISREDWESLVRDNDILVGDLYEWLLAQLDLRDIGRSDIRMNFALWEQTRANLQSVCEKPLKDILLSTPLVELFPQESRLEKWGALRESMPYRIRQLEYPPWVRTTALLISFVSIVCDQAHFWMNFGQRIANVVWFQAFAIIFVIFGIWMISETYLKLVSWFSSYRTSFPPTLITVKDLCREIVSVNYIELCQDNSVPLDPRCMAVWQELTETLSVSLGVEIETVSFRSRLFADLGCS